MGRRIEKLGNEHGVSSDLRMSAQDCTSARVSQAVQPKQAQDDAPEARTDGTNPVYEASGPISNRRNPRFSASFRTLLIVRWLLIALGIATFRTTPAALAATPPDPVPCLQAFYEVRTWLDQGRFPRLDAPESRIEIPGSSAVGVMLRLDGRVVGRGLDPAADALAVRRAAGRALSQALGDRVIRTLPDSVRDSAGSRLALEIEFAGMPRPIVASSLGSVAGRIRPGIDGIVLKRGDRLAIAMPGRLLATGTADATGSTLLRLVDELGLPPRDLEELRGIDSLELARFETMRLGQSDVDAEPGVRLRSGDVIEAGSLDPGRLEDLQAGLNARLLRWRPPVDPRENAPGDGTRPWFGDFDPIANRHVPLESSLRDRLLATWALAASGEQTIGPDDLVVPDDQDLDAEIADLGLLASLALGDEDRIEAWLAAARRLPAGDDPPALARRAAALIGVPAPGVTDQQAHAAHDDAWEACRSVSDILAGFDWLGIAEARLAARMENIPSPRAVSLRAIRDALLARQIDDGDDAGGIPLLGDDRRSIDARNLRPMLGMAVLTGLPGEDEAGTARGRNGLSGLLRLLEQLMMSEEEAGDLAGGRMGLDGIADSLANPRQSLSSTARASLILDHLLRLERPLQNP